MTIGFSPFLTADVDEASSLGTQWSSADGGADGARLELIRRRVVTGFYLSPSVDLAIARRVMDRAALDDV
jgi:hypothetical protein